MDGIDIMRLGDCYGEQAARFIKEYMPDVTEADILSALNDFPDAAPALVLGGRVIGAAVPKSAKRENELMLKGIAIEEAYRRQGYGTALLRVFERAAAAYGYKKVSLGSAAGYPEKFYIHCGYAPVCFKVYDGGTIKPLKTFADMEDYHAFKAPVPDGFVVFEKTPAMI